MSDLFNVHQWFVNNGYEKAGEWMDAKRAVEFATSLATSVGARLGTSVRVMITDHLDCCAWEWRREFGVIHPPGLVGLFKDGLRTAPPGPGGPYRCRWCGAASWKEEIPAPPSYCHPVDHGTYEEWLEGLDPDRGQAPARSVPGRPEGGG